MAPTKSIGSDLQPEHHGLITTGLFDATTTVLKATGLSKEQYLNLCLVWIEVRRFIETLSNVEATSLDLATPLARRAEWLKGVLAKTRLESQVENDPAGRPTSVWDHIDPTGLKAFWVTWSTAASNIWLSRLWETEFAGLRHSVPLRMVHKYYMLQLEVDQRDTDIFISGNKSKAYIQKKTPRLQTEAFQIFGETKINERLPFTVPVPKKRFPPDLTPSTFWGMLQIFWYHNLKVIIAMYGESTTTSHKLNAIFDRISWYFDGYCNASGFVGAGKTFLEYLGPVKRQLEGKYSLSDTKDGEKIDTTANLKPQDPFQCWKEHLNNTIYTPEFRDFDYMLATFLIRPWGGGDGNLLDQKDVVKVHSRAEYFTRSWDRNISDESLRVALEKLAQISFDHQKYQLDICRNDTKSSEIVSLAYFDRENQSLVGQIIDAMSKGFIKATSHVYGSSDKLSAANIKKDLDNLRRSYHLLSFQFALLDHQRDATARFVDSMDETLVLDYLEAKSPRAATENLPFTEREIAEYWLTIASQYGFISLNEVKPGRESKKSIRGRLHSPILKDKLVYVHNARIRKAREQLHLPQRARRHTHRWLTDKKIDYDEPTSIYAHLDDEYAVKFYSDTAKQHWDWRKELKARGEKELNTQREKELKARGERELKARGEKELKARGEKELKARGEKELKTRGGRGKRGRGRGRGRGRRSGGKVAA